MMNDILIKVKQKIWRWKKAKYKYRKLIKGPYQK